jgi:hypothetical protein
MLLFLIYLLLLSGLRIGILHDLAIVVTIVDDDDGSKHGLHGVIYQMIGLLVTTAVMTSNPSYLETCLMQLAMLEDGVLNCTKVRSALFERIGGQFSPWGTVPGAERSLYV